MAQASTAAALFASVKAQVPPAAHHVVDAIENLCQQRRLWNSQARVHFWLHNWLWLHLPLSIGLMVLLVGHVLTALRFD